MKLETERLVLRSPTIRDYYFFQKEAKKKHIAEKINTYYPLKKKHFIIAAMRSVGAKLQNFKFYNFAIRIKNEKKTIGMVTLVDMKDNNVGTTASWISKEYQRQGYMLESKIAINDFAFNKLNVRRLQSGIFTSNKASRGIQKKLGYKLEGTMRKNTINKATGKIQDECIYGILKSEWKKVSPKLKKYMKKKIKNL